MSVGYFAKAWSCECGTTGMHFDRSLCACGMMHHYCDGCGIQVDPCWLDDVEPHQFIVDKRRAFWQGFFDLRIWVPSSCFGVGVIVGTWIAGA